jgi:hypothetical protein
MERKVSVEWRLIREEVLVKSFWFLNPELIELLRDQDGCRETGLAIYGKLWSLI